LLPRNHPLRPSGAQHLWLCQQFLALHDRLPALLQGQAQPSGPAECLALAHLCQRRQQRYAASARFFAKAFAGQPQLADDLLYQHRYNAAVAAAVAAAGWGADAGRVGDPERALLRQWALGWLRADLEAWAELLKAGPPDARARVGRALHRWQRDPGLAGLRDAAALTKLPPGERQECGRLWADVGALLRRAQGGP
jgi:hypothetical protein